MPTRTCVACRQRQDQRELVRVSLSHTGEGLTLLAVPGRPLAQPSGRSAYFCPGCRLALKPAQLARTLRAAVSPEAVVALPQTN